MLNKYAWWDKARRLIHHVAHRLSEANNVMPDSLAHLARARDSLRLELPSITSLLPYETVDEAGFFINRNSMGCGWVFSPLSGANEALMKSLSELFKNKLTEGTDCTILLYKHPYLAQRLHENLIPILAQGGLYAELARLSLNYHTQAIHQGYANGRHVPAQLMDYLGLVFLSRPQSPGGIGALQSVRDEFESELKVAGFTLKRLEQGEFTTLLQTLISPTLHDSNWPVVEEGSRLLRESILRPGSVYEVFEEAIDISVPDEKGQAQTTRVINCELTHYPKEPFALWQTPDLFANLLRPEQGIACPFLISMSIRGVNQERVRQEAKRRAKSLVTNDNAIQNFMHPGLHEEAMEWQSVHAETSRGALALMPTVYNLVLFTTPQQAREQLAKAISSYRYLGFSLLPSRCKQWLRFLGSLPFMLTEGLFEPLKTLGMTKQLSHYNVANLLPVVADSKGAKQGLLLPTYRHQLFFLDPFDDEHLPITNYNRLTIASSGAGKSFFEQAQILDGLSRGELIFVIDLGESYKHLCQLVGGTYLDVTTLTLNPFTLFDFDGVTEMRGEIVNNTIQVRDLLAIMASPNAPLEEVQRSWLLEVVTGCWNKHGRQTTMDHILDHLKTRFQINPDQRLHDLILLLSKYGRDGLYGHYFNGETSLFNQARLVVFEMGGLQANPELLTIVLFVMMVVIQGQFYSADRRLKKRCIIDEAWRFLCSNINPIAASFLEQGFRTARKYRGGFSVITQHLSDTQNTPQGRAIAACADTHIIMRQGDFSHFVEAHPNYFDPLQQTLLSAFGEAKAQGFSNLMIRFGQVTTYHRFFCDPFLRVLFSTSGDEFGAIEALVKQGMPLAEAVQRVVSSPKENTHA